MECLTGPQGTATQRDQLYKLARLIDLPVLTATVVWATVTRVYCAPKWQTCPVALADIAIATAIGVPVSDLTERVLSPSALRPAS